MHTFYFSVNPNPTYLILGNVIQFWFLTGIAAVVGYSFYRLLRLSEHQFAIAKAKFKSDTQRLIVGLLPLILFVTPLVIYYTINPYQESFSHDRWHYVLLLLLALAAGFGLLLISQGVRLTFSQATLFGVLTAGLLIAFAYNANWRSFYTLRVHDDQVTLTYFYPQRTVSMPTSAIVHLEPVNSYRGLRYLTLRTTDGTVHHSIKMYRRAFDRQLPQLNAILGR